MGQESVEFQPVHSALFAPGVIGGVTLRNRVVMPAMTTRLADAEGYVTEELIAYYLARARGGVAHLSPAHYRSTEDRTRK